MSESRKHTSPHSPVFSHGILRVNAELVSHWSLPWSHVGWQTMDTGKNGRSAIHIHMYMKSV